MAYASKELKAKVIDLIKTEAKAKGIKVKLNTKLVRCTSIQVNISSCSIDLKKNLIETLESRLEEMKKSGMYGYSEMLKLEKEIKENTQFTEEQFADYGLNFSHHKLSNYFSGEALEFVEHVLKSIQCDYYNNSDPMTDYFDYAYYWDFSIGKNKGGFTSQ